MRRGEEYLPGVQLSELEGTYERERPGKSRDRLQGAALEWRGRALSAGPFRSEPSRRTFPPFQQMLSTPFPMRSMTWNVWGHAPRAAPVGMGSRLRTPGIGAGLV